MEPKDISVEFWISSIFQAVGVLLVLLPIVWRLVKAPLEFQLKGYGERLNRTELGCAKTDERANQLEKAQELSAFDRAALHERMGGLEVKFDKFMDSMEKHRDSDNREATQILSRLASIEAKVDIAATMEKLLSRIQRGQNDS